MQTIKIKHIIFVALLLIGIYPVNGQEVPIHIDGSGAIYFEDFENHVLPNLPEGITDQSSASDGGFFLADINSGNLNTWINSAHGRFAASDDHNCNCNKTKEMLILPFVDLQSVGATSVYFQYYFDGLFGAKGAYLLARNGTNPWDTLSYLLASTQWQEMVFILSDYLGESQVQLAFAWDDGGNWANGFAVDNILIQPLPANRLDIVKSDMVSDDYGFHYSKIPHVLFDNFFTNYIYTKNTGSNDQTDIQGKITFSKDQIKQHRYLEITDLANGNAIENQPFAISLASYGWGNYTCDYSVYRDVDVLYQSSTQMEITNKIYAKDVGTHQQSLGSWIACGLEMGNLYNFGVSSAISKIGVYVKNPSQVGAKIYGRIYRWNSNSSVDTLATSFFKILSLTDIETGFIFLGFPSNIAVVPGEKYLVSIGVEDATGALVLGASGKAENEAFIFYDGVCGQSAQWEKLAYMPEIRLEMADTCAALTLTTDSLQQISCFGLNDGAIYLSASGGTEPYQYLWQDGATLLDRLSLGAGTYHVTLSDAQGCVFELKNIELYQSDSIQIQTITQPSVCGNDAALQIEIEGGNGGNVVLFDGDTITQMVQEGLSIGNYWVEVSDQNTCQKSMVVPVGGNAGLEMVAHIQKPTCSAADGAIGLDVLGGTPPYDFSWQGGMSTDSITGISSGIYPVTITDQNGCMLDTFVLLDNTGLLSISASVYSPICQGLTGSIATDVTGGIGVYVFQWNNGLNTDSIFGLDTGVYTLTVTDAAGCQSFGVYRLDYTVVFIEVFSQLESPSCADSSDGSIVVSYTSTSGVVTYQWPGFFSTDSVLSGLIEGSYNLIASNAIGCSISQSYDLLQPSALTLTGIIDSLDYGQISLEVNGGTPPYAYIWSTGNIGAYLKAITEQGSYWVSVLDENACMVSDTFYVGGNVFVDRMHAVNQAVILYPNPSMGDSYLLLPKNSRYKTLTIYGGNGEVHYQKNIPLRENLIPLRRSFIPSAGIYFVQIDQQLLKWVVKD